MGEPFRRSAKYYDPYYLRFLDYGKHCDRLEEIFTRHGLEGSLRILDIACGTGTHCLELAERGHSCVGIDASPHMISIAKKKAKASSSAISPVFLVQDMRSLEVDGEFDAAICMFGGFGYLNTDEDLSRFFSRLSAQLKPRGLFLFEFWNIGALKESPYKTWRKVTLENGSVYYNLSESNFDYEKNILRISIEHLVHDQESIIDDFVENHNMRTYSLSEIRRLLSAQGFKTLEALNEANLGSHTPASKDDFRVFVIAEAQNHR